MTAPSMADMNKDPSLSSWHFGDWYSARYMTVHNRVLKSGPTGLAFFFSTADALKQPHEVQAR